MKLIPVAAGVVLAQAFLSTTGYSEVFFDTGNDLANFCTDENGFSDGYCMGYIIGIVDEREGDQSNPFLCFQVPSSVTKGQLVKVVSLWLKNNPAKLHLKAKGLVEVALADSFPCENSL